MIAKVTLWNGSTVPTTDHRIVSDATAAACTITALAGSGRVRSIEKLLSVMV